MLAGNGHLRIRQSFHNSGQRHHDLKGHLHFRGRFNGNLYPSEGGPGRDRVSIPFINGLINSAATFQLAKDKEDLKWMHGNQRAKNHGSLAGTL